VSSHILAYLAEEAGKKTGFPVKKVVITVPAFFNDAQRRATIKAGERAGLEVVFLSLTSGFPPFFLQKQLMKCWRAFHVAPGWRRYGQPGGRMCENKYLTFALNDFFDGIVLVFSGNGRDEVIV
jgi:hypothetical protein